MDKPQTVYVDYNVLVWATGLTNRPNVAALRQELVALRDAGYSIALSAWHIVELAAASDDNQIAEISRFADELSPVWVSNPAYVKRQELKRFLHPTTPGDVPALNIYLSQMWATYSGIVFIGEPLAQVVQSIRHTGLDDIRKAASETPDAIQIGRAALADGRLKANELIIDRGYFSMLLPPEDAQRVDHLLDNKKQLLATCPSIAVEEYLSQIRVRNSFVPRSSHAADLHHALVGLAYCDHFVTDDAELREHCRQVLQKTRLPCQLHKRPGDVLEATT
jgi:hypothetical protein